MVESKVGFPFRPLIGKKDIWDCVPCDALLSRAEKRFIEVVTWALILVGIPAYIVWLTF